MSRVCAQNDQEQIINNNNGRAFELPRRIKRSHKKSRLGCLTCKRRRIKCDEERPACDACKRRGLDCAYGVQASQAPSSPDSGESGVVGDHADLSSTPSSSEPLHRASTTLIGLGEVETDLVQHYLHHTTKTFDGISTHSQNFWQTVVPALGYSSKAVRLGMLTTAALCLSNDSKASDPKQSLHFLEAAECYGTQFVGTSSEQLRNLETGDANVHLTCSRLLTILAFAFFRVHQQYNGVTILDGKAWTWLHMLRGSSIVHQRYKSTCENVTETLANELVAAVSPSGTTHAYRLKRHFQPIEQTRQKRFAALYDAASAHSHSLSNDQAAGVISAIQALDNVTKDICSGQVISLLHSLCVWPCTVSKGFVDMLVRGNLFALSVHAHWLMLVVLAENAWFIGNMGRAGISEIIDLCSVEPERSLLDWPRQMLVDCECHIWSARRSTRTPAASDDN